MCIYRDSYDNDQGGKLILGGTDHKLMKEPFHYFNVTGIKLSVTMDKYVITYLCCFPTIWLYYFNNMCIYTHTLYLFHVSECDME